jgi:hypothetical protein
VSFGGKKIQRREKSGFVTRASMGNSSDVMHGKIR